MTADDAAVFYSVMMLLHPLFSFENIIGVFIDFQFEGGNHFAFYAHLRKHSAGSVLIRAGLKLADAFFICFKEYKIFLFAGVLRDFVVHRFSPFVADAERRMHMSCTGSRIANAKKNTQRKRSGTVISDGPVRPDQKLCASSCFCALGSKQSDLFVVESIEFIELRFNVYGSLFG